MTSENKMDSSLQSSAQPTPPLSSSLTLCPVIAEEETRRRIVKKHYEKKGYRVHSGLQFGCELVLYANDPDLVHSDFCIHIVPPGKITRFFYCSSIRNVVQPDKMRHADNYAFFYLHTTKINPIF